MKVTYQGAPKYLKKPGDTSFLAMDLKSFSSFKEHYNFSYFTNNKDFKVQINCLREDNEYNKSHFVEFYYTIQDNYIIKLSQLPEAVELEQFNYKKYRKILKDQYNEYNRAIGLYNFNVGVGSFVYLRRIFESLIIKAKSETKNVISNDFDRLDIDKKIKQLSDVLPQYLVDNNKIYKILSKGIHQLEEKECLKYFNVIRTSIELILDEKLVKIERNEKISMNQKELQKILDELKEGSD